MNQTVDPYVPPILTGLSIFLLLLLFGAGLSYILLRVDCKPFESYRYKPGIKHKIEHDNEGIIKVIIKVFARVLIAIIAFPVAYFVEKSLPAGNLLNCPDDWGQLLLLCFCIVIIAMIISQGIKVLIENNSTTSDIIVIFLLVIFIYHLSQLFSRNNNDCIGYYECAGFIGCYFRVALKFISISNSKKIKTPIDEGL
jgi:hypothetical protein